MPRFCLCFLGFVLGVAAPRGATPPPGEWKLPPLDGDLEGEFSIPVLDRAPKVAWKLRLRTEKPRERMVGFVIEGDGTRIRGEALLDPAGEGTWKIDESELNIGAWLHVMPLFAPDMAGTQASGIATLVGEGTWRGGEIGGRSVVTIREGRVDDPKHKILLEGISVDMEFLDLAKSLTAPAQVFTWRSGRYDVVPLGVGRIEFEMDQKEVRVTSALIDVFGGELQVGSLVVSMERPEFSVDARMVGVAVDQILFLLPPVLTAARGRLDGHVALKRDDAGIQIGAGRLS
jgi:hypothetical protein